MGPNRWWNIYRGFVGRSDFASAGEALSAMLMDPLVIPRHYLVMMYGAFPPLAFGTVASNIQSNTRAIFKTDPSTNISSYVHDHILKKYSRAPLYFGPSVNENEYIRKEFQSFMCPITKDPKECTYHSMSMAAVFAFISHVLRCPCSGMVFWTSVYIR